MRILFLIFLFSLLIPIANATSPSTNLFPHYSFKFNTDTKKQDDRFIPLLEDENSSSEEEKQRIKLENEELSIQENELKKRQRGDRAPSYGIGISNPIMFHIVK